MSNTTAEVIGRNERRSHGSGLPGGEGISATGLFRTRTVTPENLACFRPMSLIELSSFMRGGGRCYPWWEARRLRLEPLNPVDVPEVAAALDDLCQTAGISPEPEFWWNPLDGRAGMRWRSVGRGGGVWR